MMSRVFLDTNILVYSIDGHTPDKRDRARRLLRNLQDEAAGTVSTQVLQEFYVVATRKLGVEPAAARDLVVLLSNFNVVIITPQIIQRAIDHSITHQLSFWDALIVTTAQEAGCNVLWTEDLQDGQAIEDLRIVNPLAAP